MSTMSRQRNQQRKNMSALINDSQTFLGATNRWGRELPIYDDGYGPLWIHRDSGGINGVVRARSWADAYEICENEFLPEADDTIEEIAKEYNFVRDHVKIVRGKDGIERDAIFPDDYPHLNKVEFVRWETRETPCEDCWAENELFQEAFGFRSNGVNSTDKVKHGIFVRDLNGDSLELLTSELLNEVEITLNIKDEEVEEVKTTYFRWHTGRYVNQNGRSVFSTAGFYGADWSRIVPNRIARLVASKVIQMHSHYPGYC